MFPRENNLQTKIQEDLNLNVLSKLGIFASKFRLIPNNTIPSSPSG